MVPPEGINMSYADAIILILFISMIIIVIMLVWLLVKIYMQDDEIEKLQAENKRLRSVSNDIYKILLGKNDGDIPM